MKIVTNNVPRELIALMDMPASAQTDFDYVTDEDEKVSPRFFKYKDAWYDSHEFMRIEYIEQFKGWDGYSSDTFFSGTLVRYADSDCETVIVGRYMC